MEHELLIKKTLRNLEFDKVLEALAENASCDGARERALTLTPSPYGDEAEKLLSMTSEAETLINRKGNPPIYGVKDIREALTRAQKGASLSLLELLRIGTVLRATRGLISYIEGDTEDITQIKELFKLLQAEKEIEDRIAACVMSEDELFDHASSELSRLRRQIASTTGKAKEILQKMIRNQNTQKYLQDSIITLRGDRYVVPVKAEFRAEIPGLVHDMSGSGATCFIEPMAVVEANNELKILKSKEEEEINRIIAELSALVASSSKDIALNYEFIVEIDFLFSKARYARKLLASMPRINTDGKINLIKARHPLIEKEKVVPINIMLESDIDTMVITGPNTGGKTVTLKTLGLFSLMAAAGLHVPCEEGSEIAFFSKVLSDIGDEQSIEQSLSTFSSHMVNIVKILGVADKNSLVLLDELGAGTDPVEGAALAMAILEDLRARGAKIAATTHYSELKTYALNTRGVTNASCEFDVETLRPTYKLILGIPGKSNAYAISLRLGMSESIIERAKELTSREKVAFEDVMTEIEGRRQALEKQLDAARQDTYETNRIRSEIEEEQKRFKARRDKEIERAEAQAKQLVLTAREMYNRTINELEDLRKKKDSESFKENLNEAKASLRKHLSDMENKLDPVIEEEAGAPPPRALKLGEAVRIRSINKIGSVASLPDKNGMLQVRAGIITTKVKLTDVEIVDEMQKVKEKFAPKRTGDKVIGSMKAELDLRGQNGDDGCNMLDKYLDEASIMGLESVTIIHGKGTGALRSAVVTHLRSHPLVSSYRAGAYGEGDAGVTVVELA